VAGLLLTTESVVADKPSKGGSDDDGADGPGGGMPGGMGGMGGMNF
jgi:chaperonin GroEL